MELSIICTGTLPASAEARALRPVAYLIKPYTLDKLERALVKALRRMGSR